MSPDHEESSHLTTAVCDTSLVRLLRGDGDGKAEANTVIARHTF